MMIFVEAVPEAAALAELAFSIRALTGELGLPEIVSAYLVMSPPFEDDRFFAIGRPPKF